MFFRTQRTLSENILMIYDPLPVKFLPQKKLLVWAKNSLIFCSKLPRSQKWRYQEFLLHQKMAKEGSKNQKKIFFQKKYSKDGKKKFGDLWDHNFIFRKSPDAFRTLTLPPLPASDRPTVTSLVQPLPKYWGGLKNGRSGLKREKITTWNVFDHTDRSVDRMILPFTSADSYDPRQVCKHSCWVLKSFRKFSRDLQR